jgi:alpha-galactosidase
VAFGSWIGIYNDKMLSQGDFHGLYTFGYDSPEGYAIEKDGKMFYTFYSSSESPSLPLKNKCEEYLEG